MPNGELADKLRNAYLPYARGFLAQPEQARLSIEIDDDSIIADLLLEESDLDNFEGDVLLRREHRRAFNVLARANDPNRAPSLWFKPVGS